MPIEQPKSQYRQVADELRAAIAAGEFPRGTVLPSEPELSEKYGLSRPTINRAIQILRAEGLLRVERGRGTFVSAVPPINRNAVARYSQAVRERAGGRGAFDSELRNLGLTPRSVLKVERAQPPAEVAQILGVDETAVSTVRRARRMYADDTPVQLADSYIPLTIAADTVLEQEDSGPGGIVSRMAELGVAQARITESVTVRPPTSEEAEFLKLDDDQRVYAITHTGWTADDQAVEVCLHVMPTHQWVLNYEWSTDSEGS